ncbi:MAG: 5-dehydro-4-deoxy-D-glucuronate isomerase [Ignavibacteriaceae bacterium]|nr:5-dehydro-4-deoxy-D-glucuronate isomerase [Ignavibacteriaceae bacterium]
MEVRYTYNPNYYKKMNSEELRNNFLVDSLFKPGRLKLIYTDVDRCIIGSAVPTNKDLSLTGSKKETASEYFAERREIGVINIGKGGTIQVDGKSFHLDNKDCLYVGKGAREIKLSSDNKNDPSLFYIVSYPAHKELPLKLIQYAEAEKQSLGTIENCNKRVINKYILPGKVESCQLVMGLTEIENGSVWNTFPPHTHQRRTEIYLYFNIKDDSMVFHFMGEENETRHIVVRDKQAVISPSFSIHSGVGSSNYSFIWGMGGENQVFDDMDSLNLINIK